MKGTIVLLLNTVFLLMLLACLAQDIRTGKGIWSKTYHLLLLMALKMDLALAHTMESIHLALEKRNEDYHYSPVQAEHVRQKEQRLMEFRRQLRGDTSGYHNKMHYNRKILR